MKRILILSAITLALSTPLVAQKLYEPKRGSSERASLMNAIRTYDSNRQTGLASETFLVNVLRVQGSWAYASVEPQLAGGGESYGQAHVFLVKSAGKWKVAFSTYNDTNEAGVDALERLRKRNRSFPKALADFAMQHLAG